VQFLESFDCSGVFNNPGKHIFLVLLASRASPFECTAFRRGGRKL
jgi:hypothetical protein